MLAGAIVMAMGVHDAGVPSSALGAGPGMEEVICSVPWPCEKALAVAWCESRFEPWAYNPAGPYRGLFQVDNDTDAAFDPWVNVAMAYEKWTTRGWQPWPVCGGY